MYDLNMEQKEGTEVLINNQFAFSIANNLVFHEKIKHFNINLFFFRDVQKDGDVKLLYCISDEQVQTFLRSPFPMASLRFLGRN